MMSKWFLCIAIGLLWGCSGDDDDFVAVRLSGCNVENPLVELDWLKSEVERRKNDSSEDARYCFISQVEVDENTYFLYEDCNPFVDKITLLYDCQGENVGFVGDDTFEFNILETRTIIFYPQDTLCELDDK